MSYAFKCDICKKLYEPLDDNLPNGGIASYTLRIGIQDLNFYDMTNSNKYHLCPSCYFTIKNKIEELKNLGNAEEE